MSNSPTSDGKGAFIGEMIKSFNSSNESVLKAGYEAIKHIKTPEQFEAHKYLTVKVAESQHQKYLITALGVLLVSGTLVVGKLGTEWIKSRKIVKRKEIAPDN